MFLYYRNSIILARVRIPPKPATLTRVTHALNMRMYWFQVEENRNDFKFAISWVASVAFLRWLFDDEWLAVPSALFMAFGDGVTGIARNYFIRRRSKSGIGNLADSALPVWGLFAGVVATVVERYEYGPIDDNTLITLASTTILLLGIYFGPVLQALSN